MHVLDVAQRIEQEVPLIGERCEAARHPITTDATGCSQYSMEAISAPIPNQRSSPGAPLLIL